MTDSIPILSKKKVLEIRPEKAGLLSIFLQVISNLEWCEKNNYIPWVNFDDPNCLYWEKDGYNNSKNVWEYYFEPVSDFNLELIDLDTIDLLTWSWYSPPGNEGVGMYLGDSKWNDCPPEFYRRYINNLILKYIRIKKELEKQVNDFFTENMSHAIVCGVHVRRTDSIADVYKRPPPLQEYINEINHYLQHIESREPKQEVKVFLATDDQEVIDKFESLFKNKLILCRNFTRSSSGKALHLDSHLNRPKVGEEVLIECLLLAKCNLLIHSRSNVASVALYMNPELEHIYIHPRPPLPKGIRRLYRYLNKYLKLRIS